MIDTPAAGSSKNPLPPRVKEFALLFGWMAGLVVIAGLSWFLTQPLREQALLDAVNRVLRQSGDSRRLGAPVSASGPFIHGTWFTMVPVENPRARRIGDSAESSGAENSGAGNITQGTRAFVFVFVGEGTFFPCAAVVSPEGRVEEFIPLNVHGERMIKRFPQGVLTLNARRVEGAAL